jgi:hypothetical protein
MGEELLRLTHDDWVDRAAWNKDESLILTVGDDDTARVWDVATGEELLRMIHDDWLGHAAWNGDGSLILTQSHDGTARVWDAVTGEELVRLTHDDAVWDATWNGDESLILTASEDNTARVWDAVTGEERQRLNHDNWVGQAAWNEDESLILTRSGNDTLRVWDAETGEERFGVLGTQAWLNSDGTLLLTINGDTVFQHHTRIEDLLDAACQRAPRNMTGDEWLQFMKDQNYRPTCPSALLPPDAIRAITDGAERLAQAGKLEAAQARLEELAGWLQENGGYDTHAKQLEPWLEALQAGQNPFED